MAADRDAQILSLRRDATHLRFMARSHRTEAQSHRRDAAQHDAEAEQYDRRLGATLGQLAELEAAAESVAAEAAGVR